MKNFSISQVYKEKFPEVPFGLALISGCENDPNPPGFDRHKRKLLRKMRKRETLEQISKRIDIYESFFESYRHSCPLPKHLNRTIHSGFPRYNLMVDAHFVAEMCAGILVAVADHDRFDGGLSLDLAEAGEICVGMGGRELVTRVDEIVLRDENDIVCVLCQGADEKTRVKEDTRNVLFYSFGVPGVEGRYLEDGLKLAADVMSEFGGGTVEKVKVH